MTPAQQIFHPITLRVRAFTWPDEIASVGAIPLGGYVPARALSDDELMLRMSRIHDEDDKEARALARSAQREYQQRATSRLKERLGKEACGAFIGRKIVLIPRQRILTVGSAYALASLKCTA